MADDDDIFVYTGGDQEVPRGVTRVRIAEDVDTIPARKFADCGQLIEVEGHNNKLKKIEEDAFLRCRSLRRVMKMNGIIEIEEGAFLGCEALCGVEFVKLEIVERGAFAYCESLRSINLPSVRRVEECAFQGCTALTDALLGEELGRIERRAFWEYTALRRIAIPLKDDLIIGDSVFDKCENLSRVDVIGGIHKTISSLHMESWRDEMKEEIDRINQILPDTPADPDEKTPAIRQWIGSVLDKMEHYKTEHKVLVKEAITLLELALWKAKLEENESNIDAESVEVVRKEHRVTCGANIVIKNVLPFLSLE